MATGRNNHHRHGRRSTPQGSHVPVMLREVLDLLAPAPGKCLADLTLGHGGHSRAILDRLNGTGTLLVMDLDGIELAKTADSLETRGCRLVARHGNFAGLALAMGEAGIPCLDGLLADLGVSSMQIDDPDRGFSYRRPGPLDMRMDSSRGETAREILARISEDELAEALRELADEPRARHLARNLVIHREANPFETTTQLASFCEETLGGSGGEWKLRQGNKWVIHPAARLFQTLRLLVNREISNLKHLLRTLPDVLKPGGVACLISFHSGEDRLVKQAFREGVRLGQYDRISDDPMIPTDYEKVGNPRSRSAKLRWARKAASEAGETP